MNLRHGLQNSSPLSWDSLGGSRSPNFLPENRFPGAGIRFPPPGIPFPGTRIRFPRAGIRFPRAGIRFPGARIRISSAGIRIPATGFPSIGLLIRRLVVSILQISQPESTAPLFLAVAAIFAADSLGFTDPAGILRPGLSKGGARHEPQRFTLAPRRPGSAQGGTGPTPNAAATRLVFVAGQPAGLAALPVPLAAPDDRVPAAGDPRRGERTGRRRLARADRVLPRRFGHALDLDARQIVRRCGRRPGAERGEPAELTLAPVGAARFPAGSVVSGIAENSVQVVVAGGLAQHTSEPEKTTLACWFSPSACCRKPNTEQSLPGRIPRSGLTNRRSS